MKNVIDKIREKNLTVSLAESMTGGRLAYEFIKHDGASKVFIGSVVAYSKDVKINLLKVNPLLIDKYSAVSNEVGLNMIKGLKELIKSDIYISVTGNAGPSFELGSNELLCYINILYNNEVFSGNIVFDSSDRINNINQTTEYIIDMLDVYILN